MILPGMMLLVISASSTTTPEFSKTYAAMLMPYEKTTLEAKCNVSAMKTASTLAVLEIEAYRAVETCLW
jgi:hypothetical protein